MIKDVSILETTILSDNWYTLRKITYQYRQKDGSMRVQDREAYDRGNGATILLYNSSSKMAHLGAQREEKSFSFSSTLTSSPISE